MTQLIIQILLSLNLLTSDVDVNNITPEQLHKIHQESAIIGTEIDSNF